MCLKQRKIEITIRDNTQGKNLCNQFLVAGGTKKATEPIPKLKAGAVAGGLTIGPAGAKYKKYAQPYSQNTKIKNTQKLNNKKLKLDVNNLCRRNTTKFN